MQTPEGRTLWEEIAETTKDERWAAAILEVRSVLINRIVALPEPDVTYGELSNQVAQDVLRNADGGGYNRINTPKLLGDISKPETSQNIAMPIELRDLGRLPPSIENMAFSKIRVERLAEEEAVRFFNGLYEAALLSYDDGNWSRVDDYLGEWERDLISRVNPNAISFDSSPWAPFERSLSEARVALITTGGVYMRDAQETFVDDDPSYRVIPSTTPTSESGHFP